MLSTKDLRGTIGLLTRIANFNSFANSRANATNSSPFNYGTYNKGPISNRGGLAGGWGATSGKILKLKKLVRQIIILVRLEIDVRPNLRVHKSQYTG